MSAMVVNCAKLIQIRDQRFLQKALTKNEGHCQSNLFLVKRAAPD